MTTGTGPSGDNRLFYRIAHSWDPIPQCPLKDDDHHFHGVPQEYFYVENDSTGFFKRCTGGTDWPGSDDPDCILSRKEKATQKESNMVYHRDYVGLQITQCTITPTS